MTMLQIDVKPVLPFDRSVQGILVPIPFDTWDQQFLDCRVTGGAVAATVTALNSGQKAYWIKDYDPQELSIGYRFNEQPGSPPEWLWSLPRSPFAPSPELADQARDVTAGKSQKVRALVDHTVAHFEYTHPEVSILQGRETVPAVCGLTEGSCVDIHTYFISALAAVGSEATYLHGYYFREQETVSPGFHCWLATRDEQGIRNWDLSHALIYNRIPAVDGLNPHPGRRVVVGAGKDLRFDLDGLGVECHILCHPALVADDGTTRRTPISVHLRTEHDQGFRIAPSTGTSPISG